MSGLAGRFDSFTYEGTADVVAHAVLKTLIPEGYPKRAEVFRHFGSAIATSPILPCSVFEGGQYSLLMVGRTAQNTVEGPKVRPDLLRNLHEHFYTHGLQAMKQLTGHFQLLIVSRHRPELYLFTDKHASLPMYYTQQDGELYFSFDLKTLVESQPNHTHLCMEAKLSYLAFGTTLAPFTLFKNIYEIPPGHCLKFSDGKIQLMPYTALQFLEARSTPAHLLPHALKHSLNQRLPYYRQQKECSFLQQPKLSSHFLEFFVSRQQKENIAIPPQASNMDHSTLLRALPCNQQNPLELLNGLKHVRLRNTAPVLCSFGAEIMFGESPFYMPNLPKHQDSRFARLNQRLEQFTKHFLKQEPTTVDPVTNALQHAVAFMQNKEIAQAAALHVHNQIDEIIKQSGACHETERLLVLDYALFLQPAVRMLYPAALQLGFELAFPYLDEGIFSLSFLRFNDEIKENTQFLRADARRMFEHLKITPKTPEMLKSNVSENAAVMCAWLETFSGFNNEDDSLKENAA